MAVVKPPAGRANTPRPTSPAPAVAGRRVDLGQLLETLAVEPVSAGGFMVGQQAEPLLEGQTG